MAISKTQDQVIYDAIYQAAVALVGRHNVHGFNPPKLAPYPFILITSVQTVPIPTKSCLLGSVYAGFQVWDLDKAPQGEHGRQPATKIAKDLLHRLCKGVDTTPYNLEILPGDFYTITRTDQTTAEDLWVVDVEMTWTLS